ncbi:MAG: heat-inducible transcriptional repressor [Candidatus Tokpelaia sp. JSC161]|jgi:heat-inducible transcriptional repressor|nr:MAG: heat-inducible transcriptional repressor [Candidatus Tokpelaia sp. JSC161]
MKSSISAHTLALMNERSREIFKHIVESYLHDGEPVGSRSLSYNLSESLSPATIRNVMSDLEKLGLLYAPHVSAGRMPTESGLRFFIDVFMEIGDLPQEERKSIEMQLSRIGRTVEQFLTEASQVLSYLSHGAGLVLAAKSHDFLKHIEFVHLDCRTALFVLVTQNNYVENRIIELPRGVTQRQLVEVSNYLNKYIQGYSLSDARQELSRIRDYIRAELDDLSQQLVEAGLAALSKSHDESTRIIVHGRANLLEYIHADEDLKRLQRLFEDLETRDSILQLLDLTETGEGVRIFIGSENKLFSLSGSSLVVAPYYNAEQKVIGALGVIGPTRLDYARIVPMVDYTAQLISQLLQEEIAL